jgi:hypothetical protein
VGFQIRLRKSDTVYSKYIRKKADYICARCKSQHIGGQQASHFWGRSAESVRFDDENVDCLCGGCHQYLGANPEEFRTWKLKQLGEERYKALMVRAHITGHRDDKMQLIIAQKLLDGLSRETTG